MKITIMTITIIFIFISTVFGNIFGKISAAISSQLIDDECFQQLIIVTIASEPAPSDKGVV